MDIFDINDLDNIIDFSHVKEEKNNKHIVIDKKDIAPVKKLKSIKKEPECTCPISPDLIDVTYIFHLEKDYDCRRRDRG